MIIIYDKANTLTLHYSIGEGKSKQLNKAIFVPGTNEIGSEIWAAISEYNEHNMEHYAKYLHPLNEEAAGDGDLDYNALNYREVGELIENEMDISKLESYYILEDDREKPRKSVLKDIEKRVGYINTIEANLEENE